MKLRAITLIVSLAVALLWLAPQHVASTTPGAEPQRRTRQTPRRPAAARTPRTDYTNFSHATAEHRKSCDSCHKFPSPNWEQVRQKSEAFPDLTEYPIHASCLDCHRQQFFARERPGPKICAVCHVNATPRNTVRWPFPSLGEKYDLSEKGRTSVSDFVVNFPHDKHQGLFSEYRPAPDGAVRFLRASFTRAARQDDPAKLNAACATCHQTQKPQGDSEDEFLTKPPKDLAESAYWLKKGTFKTAPRDHATCFTCHSADAGLAPAPADCAACHKLPPADGRIQLARAHDDSDPQLAASMGATDRTTLLTWARRGAVRFRHEWPPHDLACVNCHQVAAMNTADASTRKVNVLSCGGEGTGCHIEPTPDGILNAEFAQKLANPSFQCTKCHVLNGRLPAPASHAAALQAITKK